MGSLLLTTAERICSFITARSSARASSRSPRTRRCSSKSGRARRGRRRRTSPRWRPSRSRVVSCGYWAAAAAQPRERSGRMAATRGQTHAKRDREVAQREKRERKRAKKAEAAAQRAAGATTAVGGSDVAGAEEKADTPVPRWIQ